MQTITRRRLLPVAVAGLVALGLAASAVAAPARQQPTLSRSAPMRPTRRRSSTRARSWSAPTSTSAPRSRSAIGLKAKFQNTGFDGIIAALLAKKCDAIISGMNDTAERRKQVAFVDYLSVGQSLMVKKGNPKKITTLTSLSGKSVSVEVGTTNKQFLDAESKLLVKKGKPAIKVVTFPKDTDAASALKTGRVDSYFGDSPVVAYYIKRDPTLRVRRRTRSTRFRSGSRSGRVTRSFRRPGRRSPRCTPTGR